MTTVETNELRGRMSGQVVTPDDAAYDDARAIYNAMIDRRPAVIARCRSVTDVQAALDAGRRAGLPIAVRGGGHNGPGFGTVDGGLVIDLSPMNEVAVDPAARTARVQGGATWGAVDAATHQHGLATPSGIISRPRSCWPTDGS
jgi:FAD/FMN-containing dehydrogenase